MQSDIAMMQNYMEMFRIRFPVSPYSMKSYGKKEHRISKLITPFSRGKVYLPRSCWGTNYLGKEEDFISSFISEEYMGFPIIQHDDALDVMATAYIYLEAGMVQTPLVSIVDKLDNELMLNPLINRFLEMPDTDYIDSFEGL